VNPELIGIDITIDNRAVASGEKLVVLISDEESKWVGIALFRCFLVDLLGQEVDVAAVGR